MPDKDVNAWQTRIAVAEKRFENKFKKTAETSLDYYRGNQWGETPPEKAKLYKNRAVINYTFANIKTMLPSLSYHNPKIFVRPSKRVHRWVNPLTNQEEEIDVKRAARIMERRLNYHWIEYNVKQQVNRSLLDAHIFGFGLVKLGYEPIFETIGGEQILADEKHFILRWSPFDFLVDPEAKYPSLEDARWIAFKVIKPLDEMKKDDRYSNTANLKPNMRIKGTSDQYVGPQERQFVSTEEEEIWDRVEFYEIWDRGGFREEPRMYVFVPGHDKLLLKDDWPQQYEGFPCETLYFNENPDTFYPLPDPAIYRDSQDILNRVRSIQLDHVLRFNRKYAALKVAIQPDSEAMEHFKTGVDGTIVSIEGVPDVRAAILPIQDAPLSPDVYNLGYTSEKDIREISGVTQFERGVAEKLDTATEAAIIQQSASAKRLDRRAMVEDFNSRIARKLGQLLQQTLAFTRDVPITEEDAEVLGVSTEEEYFIAAGIKDIQGEFLYTIEIGSTQPVDDQQRKQNALLLYNMFGLTSDPLIKQRELRQKVLEAFKDVIIDAESLLLSPEDIMQMEQIADEKGGMMAPSAGASRGMASPPKPPAETGRLI